MLLCWCQSWLSVGRDTWGQIHQILNLHVHIQTSPGPLSVSSVLLWLVLWAVHGARKYFVKMAQTEKKKAEFWKLLSSQRKNGLSKQCLFLLRENNRCVWRVPLWKCILYMPFQKPAYFVNQIADHVSLCIILYLCSFLPGKKEFTPKRKTEELNIKKIEVWKLRNLVIIRSILLPTGT